jgi:hypothetical protein
VLVTAARAATLRHFSVRFENPRRLETAVLRREQPEAREEESPKGVPKPTHHDKRAARMREVNPADGNWANHGLR